MFYKKVHPKEFHEGDLVLKKILLIQKGPQSQMDSKL